MMTRLREWFARQNRPTLIVGSVIAFIFVGAAFIGVARATDQPGFCRSCHEMTPYQGAWAAGTHKDVSCIECHVDAGALDRLLHKAVALKEVVSHVQGDVLFPRQTPPEVPDERCKRCHEKVRVDSAGFDHALHASRGPCAKCHPTVGHDVSTAALKQAGIYSGAAPKYRPVAASTIAMAGGGRADLEEHATVFCSRCHVMSGTKCSACHKPPHSARGECVTCHAPGSAFVFAHPKDRTGCQTCHQKGPKHTTIKGACNDCHKEPGVAWSFKHPPKTAKCSACHMRPPKHRGGECSACHAAGVNWVFTHPGRGATCTLCHTRPAKHRAGECSTCHGSAGASWKFWHPGANATCTNCHSRPRGHASGACTKCHSIGSSWTFRHSSSSRCASCHRAPSGHYGSACSSCHSPSKAWRSASIRHPRIRGGEHSSRSFACSSCHPRGYSSATCAKCHDSVSGPGEGD